MQPTTITTLWRERTGVAIVIIIFAALSIAAAGGWHWFAGWLESSNAASWVQAIGSILAVLGSALLVTMQLRDTRRLAAEAVLRERAYSLLRHWESFYSVAQQAAIACGTITIQLNSRTDVHNQAALGDFDVSALVIVEQWLGRIEPLGNPATLVAHAMKLTEVVGNLRRLIERGLANHRTMDAAAFDSWLTETRREVTKALGVVSSVHADLMYLQSLHATNLQALNADARRE